MDTFWGQTSTFWTGVGALATSVYTVFVVVTLWYIYRQVRIGARTFELDAICRLQQLVDDFREDRRLLFVDCPLELALTHQQFASRPPGRHRTTKLDTKQLSAMALTPAQTAALESISDQARERARHVIDRLNDIGQLVEDGFIDRRVFFGKYHVMVIQCCHLVEAIRREEETRRGGNYGQRLLRLRSRAVIYNDIWPKHRSVPVKITRKPTTQIICGPACLPV